MERVVVQANAKINLTLAVKHKRPDGFHEIESIFQEIDFGDIVEMAPAEGIHFTSNLQQLNRMHKSNTCMIAARLMQEKMHIPGVSIKLEKNIPLGTGLGGGSSDAAAVLKGIGVLYNLDIMESTLWKIAQQIGSDVPFFLSGKTAHVSGRGELIKPLAASGYYFVLLVLPDIQSATGEAYKNLKRGLTKEKTKFKFMGLGIYASRLNSYRSVFYNDFEKPVFSRYPQLADIKDSLYRLDADFAAMSGSGSALFGLFRQESAAQRALRHFAPAYHCVLTQPVLDVI
jgi:4-diphosphocytidyl-2-C-methyl-D-erythritol kinase